MTAGQGHGGPVGRSSRTLSTTGPGPNGEGEPRPEKEATREPSTDEKEDGTQPSQVSRRGYGKAYNAPAPEPVAAPLSRNPSEMSTSTSSAGFESRRSPAPPQDLEPPVTKSSLHELELCNFRNNAILRHKINFDPGLHFIHSIEGDKCRRKHDRAKVFWMTVEEELVELTTDRNKFYAKHSAGDDWCLPKLFKCIKEIIQILVPQCDRQPLREALDVDFLMQQLYHGTADLEKLASWFSQVLKSYCAPMRDKWIDAMYSQLSDGNANNNPEKLVEGLRSLLDIVEAMKLDVANNQIRVLRYALIEGTTAFEQNLFTKKLRNREMDISDAKTWYQEATRTYLDSSISMSSHFGNMTVFFQRLSRSMLPSAGDKSLPGTFLLDKELLRCVQSDILDAINLDVCMRMYEDLGRMTKSNSLPACDKVLQDDQSFNSNTPPSSSSPGSLSASVTPSSVISAASSPNLCPATPAYLTLTTKEQEKRARTLRATLVALLQEAPENQHSREKWRSIAPSMALQIFRFADDPLHMPKTFEKEFTENVGGISSPIYQEMEEAYHTRLLATLATRVCYFKSLSGVSLFSIAAANHERMSSCVLDTQLGRDQVAAIRMGQRNGGVEDIATRIAHIGVVHWRVWASIAYTGENDVSQIHDSVGPASPKRRTNTTDRDSS